MAAGGPVEQEDEDYADDKFVDEDKDFAQE